MNITPTYTGGPPEDEPLNPPEPTPPKPGSDCEEMGGIGSGAILSNPGNAPRTAPPPLTSRGTEPPQGDESIIQKIRILCKLAGINLDSSGDKNLLFEAAHIIGQTEPSSQKGKKHRFSDALMGLKTADPHTLNTLLSSLLENFEIQVTEFATLFYNESQTTPAHLENAKHIMQKVVAEITSDNNNKKTHSLITEKTIDLPSGEKVVMVVVVKEGRKSVFIRQSEASPSPWSCDDDMEYGINGFDYFRAINVETMKLVAILKENDLVEDEEMWENNVEMNQRFQELEIPNTPELTILDEHTLIMDDFNSSAAKIVNPNIEGSLKHLPDRLVVQVGKDIAQSLEEMHRNNLIYGGLISSFVGLNVEGSGEESKITKCKLTSLNRVTDITNLSDDEKEKIQEQSMETNIYELPHELLTNDKTVTEKTDLYSLGVILFRLRYGDTFFTSEGCKSTGIFAPIMEFHENRMKMTPKELLSQYCKRAGKPEGYTLDPFDQLIFDMLQPKLGDRPSAEVAKQRLEGLGDLPSMDRKPTEALTGKEPLTSKELSNSERLELAANIIVEEGSLDKNHVIQNIAPFLGEELHEADNWLELAEAMIQKGERGINCLSKNLSLFPLLKAASLEKREAFFKRIVDKSSVRWSYESSHPSSLENITSDLFDEEELSLDLKVDLVIRLLRKDHQAALKLIEQWNIYSNLTELPAEKRLEFAIASCSSPQFDSPATKELVKNLEKLSLRDCLKFDDRKALAESIVIVRSAEVDLSLIWDVLYFPHERTFLERTNLMQKLAAVNKDTARKVVKQFIKAGDPENLAIWLALKKDPETHVVYSDVDDVAKEEFKDVMELIMANPESDNISQLEANFFKWLDADNQMKPFASIVRKKINESKGLFRLELLQFCASTAGRLIGLKGERERFEALSRNASWLERIIDHRDPKQRYRFLKELLELPTKALAEGLSQFKGGSQANTRGMLSWILLTRLESQGLLSGHVTVQKKERGKVRSEEVPKKTKVLEFVKSNTYSDRIEVRNLYHFLFALIDNSKRIVNSSKQPWGVMDRETIDSELWKVSQEMGGTGEEQKTARKKARDEINVLDNILSTYGKESFIEALQSNLSYDEFFINYFSELFEGTKEIDRLGEKLEQTFGKFRIPTALYTYVSRIKELPDNEQEKVFKALNDYVVAVLKGKDYFQEMRYDAEASEHLKQLFSIPGVKEKWLAREDERVISRGEKAGENLDIQESDDPEDLLLIGTEANSCQRVDGDPQFNKCLVSYCINGEIRAIVIKGPDGKIVARSVMRLLWDEQQKRPVILLETLYGKISTQIDMEIQNWAKRKAKRMNVTLVTRIPSGDGPPYEGSVTFLGGRAPFVYSDAGGGVKSEGFTVRDCKVLVRAED